VTALLVGGYSLTRTHPLTRVGTVPASFLAGRHGTEVVIVEVDDFDGDPRTVTLRPSIGGDVKLYPMLEPWYTTVPGARPPDQVCHDIAATGSRCATSEESDMDVSYRSAQGFAVIFGLTGETAAVAFDAGAGRYWARPTHGIVVFPFVEAAAARASAQAYTAGGVLIRSYSAVDYRLTTAEVAGQVVSKPTSDVLASGQFFGENIDLVRPMSGATEAPRSSGEIARYRGRASKTGFSGPFTATGALPPCPDCGGPRNGVWAVTVRTADSDAIRSRLAPLGGTLRASEVSPGQTLFIWFDDTSPIDFVETAVASLRSHPADGRPGSYDIPHAWSGPNRPWVRESYVVPLTALLTDPVGSLDGHQVLAQSDDLGETLFAFADADLAVLPVTVGSSEYTTPRLPKVGELVGGALAAVPPDVETLTLTLSDGTVVQPTLVDVTAVAAAKLYFVPYIPYTPILTIARVDVTRR
jgi:hypothetical protein